MTDYDPPYPLNWAIGDLVFARYLDASTGRYVIRQEGMVVRIEGNQLVLATNQGEKLRNASDWPTWKTREAAEATIAKTSRPVPAVGPMAHYTEPASREPEWLCGRCENIREGLPPPEIAPDHSPRCPWRGTGKDPAVG